MSACDALRTIAQHCLEARKLACAWGEEGIRDLLQEALIEIAERLSNLPPQHDTVEPSALAVRPGLSDQVQALARELSEG